MYGDFGSTGTSPHHFYMGIVPIVEIENVVEVIDLFRSKERIFRLFKYRGYENLSRKFTQLPLHLIIRRNVGDRDMALVSNR